MSKFSMYNAVKNVDFVGKSKLWYSIPAAIIVIGLIIMIFFGMNVGIDFEGGAITSISFGEELSQEVYTQNLNDIIEIIEDNGLKVSYSQKSNDELGTVIVVRYSNIGDEEVMNAKNETIKASLIQKYQELYDESSENITMETIGSTASRDLVLRSFISILAAAIVMLIYIGFRFDWLSGLSAVITLILNVLIMIALTTVFRIQVNTSFIAAVITIIGYSINATIVIFDRIRENRKKYAQAEKITAKDIANISIRESFTRTVYSTFTTLATITVLAIIAVPTIKEFALPIIFGLVAGIYSSICVAPALWVLFINSFGKKKKVGAKK